MPVRDPTSSQLAHELRETLVRVVRRMRAEPAPSVGRVAVLRRLEADGPSSISDLAARERMRPQSMAEIVHDLQTTGLVSRRADSAEGRRALIELTPAGLNLLQATHTQREAWLTEALERELDASERALLHEASLLLSRIADA
ncbi:MAG: MarR family winged helix-turn-helix transcriptional regulator [Solirubrobacteraceae bacterium]